MCSKRFLSQKPFLRAYLNIDHACSGSEAMAFAESAAQTVGRGGKTSEGNGEDPSALASGRIKKASDIMAEVELVFGQATEAGRYVNQTVIEAVKAQVVAINQTREKVEGLLKLLRQDQGLSLVPKGQSSTAKELQSTP
jgi:hypothetical protein